MINYKNFHPNWMKIDEKSYKNIIIYCIGYITIKNLSYVKIDSVNPLYLIIDKGDGNIEESNGNKYLTLAFTDKNKDILTLFFQMFPFDPPENIRKPNLF